MPVFERRLAAVVLLQSRLAELDNSDLTRIEGFLRTARLRELADPLAVDVVGPLIAGLDGLSRGRAEAVLERWLQDPVPWLRRAALLAPLRGLRAGSGDWEGFVRQAKGTRAHGPGTAADPSGRNHDGDGDLVGKRCTGCSRTWARIARGCGSSRAGPGGNPRMAACACAGGQGRARPVGVPSRAAALRPAGSTDPSRAQARRRVIYRQSVNGTAADTLNFDAAAREGADVVNQVLGRLP